MIERGVLRCSLPVSPRWICKYVRATGNGRPGLRQLRHEWEWRHLDDDLRQIDYDECFASSISPFYVVTILFVALFIALELLSLRFAALRGWWPCLRSSSACAYMYVRIGTAQLLLLCTAAIPLPPHWSQWKPRIRLEETVIAFLEKRRWIIMLYYVKDRGGRSRMTATRVATRVATKTALGRTSQC